MLGPADNKPTPSACRIPPKSLDLKGSGSRYRHAERNAANLYSTTDIDLSTELFFFSFSFIDTMMELLFFITCS
jgi:hypothetical protein